MKAYNKIPLLALMITTVFYGMQYPAVFADQTGYTEVVLTVAQSTRLIARGVKNHPVVKAAYENGTIAICRGTTASYVAEEFLGKNIEPFSYTYGVTLPKNSSARKNAPLTKMNDVIIRNGVINKEGETIAEAVKKMDYGDVIIKSANALNYEKRIAGGLVGSPTGGTVGIIWGPIYGKKLRLVIPIGLEKEIGFDILKASEESINAGKNLSLIPMTGIIVTEIEAIEILSGAYACQIGAGGVRGAEGSVRLLIKGTREQIDKVEKIISEIESEEPY